jgi:hypothetical protein
MRKISFMLAFFALTIAAKAQDGAAKNVIKVNPLGLIFGSASVAYERALNEKSSFVIAPQFGGFKFGGFKYSSFGAGAEYRFYLGKTKTAPEGLYAGPGIFFTSGTTKVDDGSGGEYKTNFTSFGGKAVIGNQWIFNSGCVIDLNGGVSFSKFSYKDDENSYFSGLKGSGVFPSLSFAIGYNF